MTSCGADDEDPVGHGGASDLNTTTRTGRPRWSPLASESCSGSDKTATEGF